jgi:hypothetical protein
MTDKSISSDELLIMQRVSLQMRYDYFLIWGNGLAYKDEILDNISSHGDFEIAKIVRHSPRSIKKLVKEIYSYDYAPYWHLRGKTEYLLTTIPQVLFIFVKNMNPMEDFSGEGAFRHIESSTVKLLKEQIRNKFNERKEDRRTENHVIHASDNESQVDHILRYLGFKEGLNYLKRCPNKILDVPYYISEFNEFAIRNIEIDKLFCNILRGTRASYKVELVPIEESPHHACLQGNPEKYEKYIQEFLGGPLDQYYSVKKFLNLSKDLIYPNESAPSKYILVKELGPDEHVILDGLHRTSILKSRDQKKLPVAVIEA